MSDTPGELEAKSSPDGPADPGVRDDQLGSPYTDYTGWGGGLGDPGPYANRGLEANDGYVISADMLSITVNMTVDQPGDWIRVVTEGAAPAPEPATMLLLGTGLIGLAGFRRKLKKK
jgi:hypothetical protein